MNPYLVRITVKVFRTLAPETQRNLFFLFLTGLCFWTSLTALLPTLPLYIEFAGATQQQVGLVMGSFAIGLLFSRGLLGQWADQRSRKLVVQVGTLAVAIAPFGYAMFTSLPLFVAIRAFHGISVAGLTTGYSALVVDLSPPEKRGEIIGYMSLGVPLGMALGPALGGYLAEIFGYGFLFLLCGLLGILAFLCAGQVREASRYKVPLFPQTPTPAVSPSRRLAKALLGVRWSLVKSPPLRIPAIILLFVGLVFGGLTAFIPAYIRDSNVGLNAGLFYTAVAIASFVIRLVAGRASDRLGRGFFITCSLCCYVLAMMILALAQYNWQFLLAGLAQGAGGGTLLPMMTALVADRSKVNERGQSYAFCVGGFDVGIALGAPLAGLLMTVVNYRGLFTLSAGFLTLALWIFITLSSKDLEHSMRFAFGRGADAYSLIGKQ